MIYLPDPIIKKINLFIGNEENYGYYWILKSAKDYPTNRCKLTILNYKIDLLNSDWFLDWQSVCAWANWREKHKYLGYSPVNLDFNKIPDRLSHVSLEDDLFHLKQIDQLDSVSKNIAIKSYIQNNSFIYKKAQELRRSVHLL